MAIRFRRRIKLAPGLHLNLSGSGLSFSAGPKGASMTIGGRGGTFMNTGIPGTGIYIRERVGDRSAGASRLRSSSDSNTAPMTITISVEDDGSVTFRDQTGELLDERVLKQVKEQQKEAIKDLMQGACDRINVHIEALEEIHHATPSPNKRPNYELQPYVEPRPTTPLQRKHGIMGALFSSKRAQIDKENAEVEATYQRELLLWNNNRQQHEAREVVRRLLIEEKVLSELPAMEIVLEQRLMDIVWPRETALSSEVRNDGRVVMIDVDLPEIGELPRKTATMPARGYKLPIKELSSTRIQQLYMRHVHGIGFRILGEVFYVLPKAEQIVLSGYTQRPDKATGEVNDEYVYSVQVNRCDFAEINFSNLKAVDPVEALGRFNIRREITKTGLFKEIAPFDGPSET